MAQAAATGFSAAETKGEFVVKYNGETFISGEGVSLLKNGFSSGKIKTFNPAPAREVIHVSGCENNVEYLKELNPEKHRIELSVLLRTLPWSSSRLDYWFKVPVKFLKGCKYKALIGNGMGSKWVSGAFSGSEGNNVLNNVCFLAITGSGKNLYIDLTPCGPLNHFGNYSGVWGYDWYVRRQNDYYLIGFTLSGKIWGYSAMKKLIIGEGSDFKSIHPVQAKAYTEELKVEYFVNFGGNTAPGSSVPFKLGVFSEKNKFGWAKNYRSISFYNSGFKGPICGRYAGGTGKADFKFKVLPGHYILSLTFGSAIRPLGPFDVYINGVKKASNIASTKGNYLSVPVSAVSDTKELTVSLTGKWAVSSLILQPYLFRTEDYVIRRNWWVVDTDVPDYAQKRHMNKQ